MTNQKTMLLNKRYQWFNAVLLLEIKAHENTSGDQILGCVHALNITEDVFISIPQVYGFNYVVSNSQNTKAGTTFIKGIYTPKFKSGRSAYKGVK